MNEETAVQRRILDNMRLAYSISLQYKGPSLELEDIQSLALLGLTKAAKHFDESRGVKFATFAVPIMHNEIRHELRKARKHSQCLSMEDERAFSTGDGSYSTLLETIPYEESGFVEVEHSDLIAFCLGGDGLKEKEKRAVFLVLCDGMKQEDAGKLMGISQTMVSRYVKSGIQKIRKKYLSYGSF